MDEGRSVLAVEGVIAPVGQRELTNSDSDRPEMFAVRATLALSGNPQVLPIRLDEVGRNPEIPVKHAVRAGNDAQVVVEIGLRLDGAGPGTGGQGEGALCVSRGDKVFGPTRRFHVINRVVLRAGAVGKFSLLAGAETVNAGHGDHVGQES